jgi:regulatory protein
MAARRSGEEKAALLDGAALRQKAFRLLARRERSRAEMQRLLGPYCAEEGGLAMLLDDLQARGSLSESRLAAQFVHSRRSRSSASRIRQQLALRGVEAEVIRQSTEGLEAGDLATALALWRRRFGAPATEPSQRARQVRFLLNRGFGYGIALEVLRIGADPES